MKMNNQIALEGTAPRGFVAGDGLRSHGSRKLRPHSLLAALLTALLLAVSVVVVVPAASAAPGDVGVEGPSHTGTGTPTGTKRSTSGLWFNDGTWWGNMWDTASSDFHIFRFDSATSKWVDTGVATDTRANTHHDVLWDGKTLYVASYRFVNDGLPAEPNYPTTMRRYSYDSAAKTYKLLGSSNINNQRVEALTIDKDSKGRLWATWQQGNRIYLNNTDEGGVTWGTPFQHPASLSNVSVDDISAVIAFGGKVGVMWSRQVGGATDGMYWSYREDSATSRTAWTAPVAAVLGQRSGDDHMNLKWLDSSGGRVFAAIKTSFTSSSQPLIQLLALDTATAKWAAHTIATVAECPNRVMVLIDESTQMLRTFATYPKSGTGATNAGVCTSSGGAIYEKSAPVSNPGGLATATKTLRIMDADQYVHNVTSTKQNLNSSTGLLLLADVNATSRYWHYYERPAGGSDTTPPNTTITSGPAATSTSTSASFAFTSSEANSTFQCSLDGAARVACTSPRAYSGLSVGPHTFDVWATDAAGNADGTAARHAWSVSSGGGDTTAPETTITSGPAEASTSTSTSATFEFTSTEAGSTFQCSLDSAAYVACTSPRTYTGLSVGSHTFNVRAIDAAGNTDATPATRTWSVSSTGGTTTTVTLTATADSYVSAGAVTVNNGTSTMLGVDNSPVEATYLKFNLSGYAGRTVQSAVLQLRSAGSGSTGTQNVKLVANDSWTETGITYNNKPALGTSILGTLGPTTTNTNYNISLNATALLGELGGELSLGMDSSSSDGVDLNSKEASSGLYAPKLVLTLAN
ncbi:DNRLRE domain-containing protein [Pseudarthrobacter sp. R1]|uniref:CBM96 family carbohydrate-binding protein n=1 Tax=Pseudarthrobacter sp. R1 TaxID=2944934 RepID=UPI00210D7A19|nr:DNRLRE domain-containing protein [Pseudarthrobacter sp. R1]MCQ6270216.1 DNRLRE domain-containing protein [Pseudarthrobacter sp. R1]